MKRVLAVPGVLVLALLSPTAASGQIPFATTTTQQPVPGTPPRDAVQKTGTAIIRGHVVAAETGQPLRKAQVRLFAQGLGDGKATTTDAQGRYEFKELPAGRYTVSASKGSYVSLTYGQTRPLEAGKPLEIGNGQTAEKIDFSLPKGSVLTGRVVDEFGEPMENVQLSVLRYQFSQGRRRLVNAGRSGSTNDIGEFRIYGLPPGQYYLSATLRNFQMAVDNDDRSGYAPTYYPGTPNPEAAQKINVGIGQSISDLTMMLTPPRTARITGSAFDTQGKPFPGMVMMVQRTGNMFMSNAAGRVMADGTFTINGVAPGEYTLQASGNGMGMSGDDPEFASMDIVVGGEDISGVQLVASKLVTVTGRVIVDAAAAASFRPGSQNVFASLVQPDAMNMGGSRPGKVNDDFTFSVKVRPGKVKFTVGSMGPGGPSGFYQRAVRVNGVDVIDTGVDIKPNEDLAGVEIEMTNIAATLSGTVVNGRGEPVKDYTIVVFPQDRERWGPGSRYTRSSRPDQDGRFKIVGLPPGDYSAVAVDYVEPGEQGDPEFLDRIKGKATHFSINEGETKAIDLKMSTVS